MKRLLLICLMTIPLIYTHAGNKKGVSILTNDDRTFEYLLSTPPKFTYDEENLVMSVGDYCIVFPSSYRIKCSFFDVAETINDPKIKNEGIQFAVEDNNMKTYNLQPNSAFFIYDINGKIIMKDNVDANGSINIALNGMPKGIYIIKTNNITFKYKKR